VNGNGRHDGNSPAGVFERTKQEARYFWGDISEVRSDLSELAAKEVQLLGAEISEQVSHVGRIALWGTVAAVFGLLTLAFLATAAMFALATELETWASALIVTGGLAGLLLIAGLMAYMHVRSLSVVPRRTVRSLKEDAEWVKNLVSSSKR
jgi:nitrate reductase gamma subunit